MYPYLQNMNRLNSLPIVRYEIDKENIIHIFRYMEKDVREAKIRLGKEDYGKALTSLDNIKERIGKIKKEINKATGVQEINGNYGKRH